MPDDAFGAMVRDFHRDTPTEPPVYRRDDGDVREAHLEWYFTDPEEWPRGDDVLTRAAGRVLDVGCGPGRTAVPLERQGHDVFAVDVSPGAIEVARARGVSDAAVVDLTTPAVAPGTVDTALLLGGQLALGGTLDSLAANLDRFGRLAAPGGRLVADLHDPTRGDDHDDYLADRWVDEGVASRRFRVEYDGLVGPWIHLLMLSPDRFRTAVDGTDWQIESVDTALDGDGGYRVTLVR